MGAPHREGTERLRRHRWGCGPECLEDEGRRRCVDRCDPQLEQAVGHIDVYRAMGGGWVDEADRMSESAAPYADVVAEESDTD